MATPLARLAPSVMNAEERVNESPKSLRKLTESSSWELIGADVVRPTRLAPAPGRLARLDQAVALLADPPRRLGKMIARHSLVGREVLVLKLKGLTHGH